ncbi:hypothetical protein ACS5PN_12490 [Roseateles sp. NT4]
MSSTKVGAVGVVLANERDAPPVDEQPRMEVNCWRLVQLPA